MDVNPDTSQLSPQEPKKNGLLEEVEFGVGGILLGVGTFLLMLFVLNYFNIVSLSLVFPKYFGWLPHRQVAQGVPSDTLPASQGEALQGRLPSPTPTPSQKLESVPCPVEKVFCKDAKLISTASAGINFYALAYTLPEGSKLQAVFPGNIGETVQSGPSIKPHPLINFTQKDHPTIVTIYNFFGAVTNPLEKDPSYGLKTFNTGETIGVIGKSKPATGEGGTNFPNIEPFNGANLLFSIKQGDTYLKLKIKQDGSGILVN